MYNDIHKFKLFCTTCSLHYENEDLDKRKKDNIEMQEISKSGEMPASKIVKEESGGKSKQKPILIEDGKEHVVFKPSHIKDMSTPQYAKLAFNLTQQKKGTPQFKTILKERQLEFTEHVKTTQEVIKEQTKEYIEFDEMNEEERKAHLRSIMAKVSARLQEKGKQQATAANVFSDALTKLGKKTPLQRDDTTISVESIASLWRAKTKKSDSCIIPISVDKFKRMQKKTKEEKSEVSAFNYCSHKFSIIINMYVKI